MDKGAYSIAMGEAIFQASAQSASPDGAAAAADTFLDVSGADFIIERESRADRSTALHDASAFSELDYLAIDIHGWSPPHGPIVIELGGPFGHHQSFGHDTLQGDFAQVFAMAEAHGANTLSATLTSCADGREPLLVRECNGNGGALGARLNPAGRIRSLARKEIGVMSGSTNTFFAAMNSTAQAMGDLTATKTATAAAVLPGASIGYAAAVAVAQDTSPGRPHTSATTDGLRERRIHHELAIPAMCRVDFPYGPTPVSVDVSVTAMSTHGGSDFLSGYSLSGLMGPSLHGLF